MNAYSISHFRDAFRYLSNFYPSPINVNGWYFPTVEHCYQAHKVKFPQDFLSILNANSPGSAKRLGKQYILRDDWEMVKLHVMQIAVLAKFKQHPLLKYKLIDTFPMQLVEGNNWHDNYWGVCYCSACKDQGKNMLGKILMNLRDVALLNNGKI